jgi:hypothetical protein
MKLFKKLKFHLQLWDGIWSILVAGILFFLCGVAIQHFFVSPSDPQNAPGFYDPSFIQAAAYASFIQVVVHTAAMLGIYFGFRRVWRYFYGYKPQGTDTVLNQSKVDFDGQRPVHRLLMAFGLYLFFALEWLLIFKMLV